MSDTGMLTMKSGMPAQLILTVTNEDNTFMGALVENYVAQALSANKHPLYYWKNDNTAEVDFILQQDDKVIPLEVKKGLHVRSKSLGIFGSRYDCPYKIRVSQKNFGFDNNIKSVPLYAVFCI
jgi:predicted AAA+ superfamily ATPase